MIYLISVSQAHTTGWTGAEIYSSEKGINV